MRQPPAGSGILLRDGTRVYSVSFADDIVLMASSPGGLQALLDAAFADSRRNVYRFSTEKSEVVVFGASRDAPHRRLWNFTLGLRTWEGSPCVCRQAFGT